MTDHLLVLLSESALSAAVDCNISLILEASGQKKVEKGFSLLISQAWQRKKKW